MKKNIILTADNISKQYRLGLVGTGTLSHDLNRWWAKVRGKEDPYLKIGAENDRSKAAEGDYVWALQDINFEVEEGEVLGIIGKNGAGKSTLLKILSRVTMPTTGSIKTKGRIASLLEVGTGFHPELTGRENIYLNGAILGMSKSEIKAKEDEIIDFSGCAMYVDTPVKRYSSGMRVRLAFAVAAHLEPDILVVDEVLAVGDAEFQKKAVGKMKDISGSGGRTVLFVSHNMESIQQLCSRCIVLKNGKNFYEGNVEESISFYLRSQKDTNELEFPIQMKNSQILNFEMLDHFGNSSNSFITGKNCTIQLSIKSIFKEEIKFNIRYQIFDDKENLISTINAFHQNATQLINFNESFTFNCKIPKIALTDNNYVLGVRVVDFTHKQVVFQKDNFFEFKIENGDYFDTGKLPSKENSGKFLIESEWQ